MRLIKVGFQLLVSNAFYCSHYFTAFPAFFMHVLVRDHVYSSFVSWVVCALFDHSGVVQIVSFVMFGLEEQLSLKKEKKIWRQRTYH